MPFYYRCIHHADKSIFSWQWTLNGYIKFQNSGDSRCYSYRNNDIFGAKYQERNSYSNREIMEWLTDYHLGGIVIGICTFLIIGLFHPIVVKAEYYWGTRCWWIFLILGIAGIIGSILINDILISSLIGVFSFSSFWTIKEIFEQRERVLKGWFPMNPKRKHEYEEK